MLLPTGLAMIIAVLTGFGAALAAPLLHRWLPRWAGWLCALLPLSLFSFFGAQVGAVAAGRTVRAAYFSGVPLWEKSVRDDLASSGEWCKRDDADGAGTG